MKVDDDMYVNVDGLRNYLENMVSEQSLYTVVGVLKINGEVQKYGKWAEYKYIPKRYPNFPLGSFGHAVTRAVASYIVSHESELANYQGEDTSLGIWIDESPLKTKTTWVNSNYLYQAQHYSEPIVGDVSPCKPSQKICLAWQKFRKNITMEKNDNRPQFVHSTLDKADLKKIERSMTSAISHTFSRLGSVFSKPVISMLPGITRKGKKVGNIIGENSLLADKDSDCPSKALDGNCKINQKWMRVNCALSCFNRAEYLRFDV
eukprot:UC4_evm3s865